MMTPAVARAAMVSAVQGEAGMAVARCVRLIKWRQPDLPSCDAVHKPVDRWNARLGHLWLVVDRFRFVWSDWV